MTIEQSEIAANALTSRNEISDSSSNKSNNIRSENIMNQKGVHPIDH